MEPFEQDKRERILLYVRDGWKSDYWTVIRDKVKEWIEDEEIFLDGFKSRGMTERHLDEYNRSRDQIDFMKKFLNINQVIIADNETILARLKAQTKSVVKKIQSFVTK